MAKTCCICMSPIEINKFKSSLVNNIIDRFHAFDEKCQFLSESKNRNNFLGAKFNYNKVK